MTALRIDGRHVEALEGESVLDAARREGFEIPTLCHHELLKPYGACRVCLVEISKNGQPGRLAAACTHPVLEGIHVALDTPAVTRARRLALELVLAHAPEAPDIVAMARKYGIHMSRFQRVEQPKNCILCGLCERVCRDVVGAGAITLAGRGGTRRAEPPFVDDSFCIGCGACQELCPTGVLDMRELAAARFRRLPGEDRFCRYALMGLLPAALCANNYQCERCETEQSMVDNAGGHPLLRVQNTIEYEANR